ncbi:unnamed protein product [Spirodela intermedia]|nr:unnamed protein product [Spirodela intermedia]CAA6655279.1 unnamed protein product [Spirodela intermedia]CAA7390486.1 unnamed protein product [Spirodela intermedia]
MRILEARVACLRHLARYLTVHVDRHAMWPRGFSEAAQEDISKMPTIEGAQLSGVHRLMKSKAENNSAGEEEK